MTIPFTPFFNRLREATDIVTQMDLARALGVNRSAVTQAKLRDAVPQKWILALARRYFLSPDWLEFGKGASQRALSNKKEDLAPESLPPPAGLSSVPDGRQKALDTELVYIPKAAARLCAGGGSFEVETLHVAEYPFQREQLAGMGNPSAMIFMDVVGESMEPGICDGDMVLIDQSHTHIDPRKILAVGLEDAIYLKRVEQRPSGLVLHSDNPAYSPMELYGDELETFRVIGKVVWLCRDCR